MPTARNSLILAPLVGFLAIGVACQQDYALTDGPVNLDPGDVTACDFSPIVGTKMSTYDCNPVFHSTDEEWGSSVGSVGFHVTDVLGHPFYQMWYTASPPGSGWGDYGLGYAVSADGTNWQSNNDNPLFQADSTAWDSDVFQGQSIVWDADFDQYVMMWGGFTIGSGNSGIGVATSPDGVNWTKNPANPVIDFQEVALSQGVQPCWPLTLTRTAGGFTAYITGSDAADIFGAGRCDIYAMSSLDLVNWNINPNPVLAGDAEYDLWTDTVTTNLPDGMGMTSAAVVEYEGILYMFYVGFDSWTEDQANNVRSATNTTLNLATSFDSGLTWNRAANNPLPVNLTTPAAIGSVGAQVVGERIHVWVGDYYEDLDSAAIGYFYYEPDIEIH